MAQNNNYTIWQRLGKVFGPDSTLDQQAPVYQFDKKQILKTPDKKEYEREYVEDVLRGKYGWQLLLLSI